MSHFSQATTAQAKVAIKRSGPSANATAIVQAHFGVLAFGGQYLALAFFINHGCFSHVVISSPYDSLVNWA